MKVNLEDIAREKPFKTQIRVERRTLESDFQSFEVNNLDFEIEIQMDPQGYVARYELEADVEMTCVTCGDVIKRNVKGRDWVALRMQQPENARIVLNQSDMNTRFLQHPELDLDHFMDEVVELELPTYPRHGKNESCVAKTGEWPEENRGSESEDSPFSGLAGLVNDSK